MDELCVGHLLGGRGTISECVEVGCVGSCCSAFRTTLSMGWTLRLELREEAREGDVTTDASLRTVARATYLRASCPTPPVPQDPSYIAPAGPAPRFGRGVFSLRVGVSFELVTPLRPERRGMPRISIRAHTSPRPPPLRNPILPDVPISKPRRNKGHDASWCTHRPPTAGAPLALGPRKAQTAE